MHSHIATYMTIAQLNWGSMPRDAFEGYDEPVKIDMEPEEALKLVLGATPDKEDEPEN
jgi:hypothetical protein